MKRFAKILLLTVLVAMMGVLMNLLPSRGQVGSGGLPPGVIDKPPAESELGISIWPIQTLYFGGQPVPDFIGFEVNQRTAVYLVEIDPDGQVTLLFPNRLARDNIVEAETHTFPQDFSTQSFRVSGSVGTHIIQAIATPFMIDLNPPSESSSEMFTVLGFDPEQVKEDIEGLIEAHGISRGAWAADWISYQLEIAGFTLAAAPPQDAKIQLFVMRREGDLTVPIENSFSPRVEVNTSDQPAFGVNIPPSGKQITVSKSNREVSFTAQAQGHVPFQSTQCRTVIETTESRDPCTLLNVDLTKNVESIKVIFVLERQPDPSAIFWFTPTAPVISQPVTFDASASEPRGGITSYKWDFNSDGRIDAEVTGDPAVISPRITHIYSAPGIYYVTLTIVPKGGAGVSAEPRLVQVTELRTSNGKCGSLVACDHMGARKLWRSDDGEPSSC